jgi:hypothetical protein
MIIQKKANAIRKPMVHDVELKIFRLIAILSVSDMKANVESLDVESLRLSIRETGTKSQDVFSLFVCWESFVGENYTVLFKM